MEFPQINQANPVASALSGYEAGQKIQNNNVLIEQNRLENANLQRENNRKYAISEARKIAYSGDPRAQEAIQLLASLDPDDGKKAVDWHKERSQRLGAYMKTIDMQPETSKGKVFEYVVGQINSGADPFFSTEDLRRAGLPDKWSSDLAPKISTLSQMHRDLENVNKAPQEDASLEATKASTANTRANTAKTQADIAKTKVETDQLTGKAKPLSSDATKTLTIATGGLEGISTIKSLLYDKDKAGNDILKKDSDKTLGGASFLPNILQSEQQQQFETARTNIIDEIGRLRSGGQISGNEETNFRKLVPKYGDKPKTIEFKLKQLEKNFSSIEKGITGRSPEKTGAENARLKYNPDTGEVE